MSINQTKRRSIRLKNYDYSQPGGYFLTICTYDRDRIFGEIVNGQMRLNEFGKIVLDEWNRTAVMRSNVELDVFVVMPDHLHGIIILHNHDQFNGSLVGARRDVPLRKTPTVERFGKPTPNSIPTIIRLFKSATTSNINRFRKTPGFPVWQRNYYEHVIRNETELNRIREYIVNNPRNWRTGPEFDENKFFP